MLKKILKSTLHFIPQYSQFITFSELGNYGRLGNQLFQYAFLRSYAIKNNINLYLPYSNYNRLVDFNIECKYVDYRIIKLIDKKVVKELQFNFDEAYFNFYDRIDFQGYFQTEKYFLNNRELLLKELSLKDEKINDYCIDYLNKIRIKNNGLPIVALHIRRGDNVPSQTKYSDKTLGVFSPNKVNYHPLLSSDYINKAKSYFKEVVFLIFSDSAKDIKWCKKNIKGLRHEYSENHDDLTDFTLMRNCDHNIIANSSFSWWAAWLNNNKKQIVIAPKNWFGTAYENYDLKDLYPKSWRIH